MTVMDIQPINLSAVQSKGQVTIPSDLRAKFGLRKGSRVAFVETNEGILITPQEVIAAQALDEIGKLLRASGIELEDLIESGRALRGKIVEEKYGLKLNE